MVSRIRKGTHFELRGFATVRLKRSGQRIFGFAMLLAALLTAVQRSHSQDLLPAPVRSEPEPAMQAVESQSWDPVHSIHTGSFSHEGWPAPHLVTREHAPPRYPPASAGGDSATMKHHFSGASRVANVRGPAPAIPQAATEIRRRTPYSYGYFGADHKQHWSLHFGARQNFTRWSRR